VPDVKIGINVGRYRAQRDCDEYCGGNERRRNEGAAAAISPAHDEIDSEEDRALEHGESLCPLNEAHVDGRADRRIGREVQQRHLPEPVRQRRLCEHSSIGEYSLQRERRTESDAEERVTHHVDSRCLADPRRTRRLGSKLENRKSDREKR